MWIILSKFEDKYQPVCNGDIFNDYDEALQRVSRKILAESFFKKKDVSSLKYYIAKLDIFEVVLTYEVEVKSL